MVIRRPNAVKVFLKNRVPQSSIFFNPCGSRLQEKFQFFQIRKNWKKKQKPSWQKLNSRVVFKQPKLVTLVNFFKTKKFASSYVLPTKHIKFNLFDYGAWRLWFLRQAPNYFKKLEVTPQKNSFFTSLSGLNRFVKKMAIKKFYALNLIFKKIGGLKFKRDKHFKIFLVRFWKSFKILVPKYFQKIKKSKKPKFFYVGWDDVVNYKFIPIVRSRVVLFKNNFLRPEIPAHNRHFLFFFSKKRNLSFVSSPIKAWIRHKKRNIFLSTDNIVARRSILSNLLVEHVPFLQLFLYYGQFRVSTSALFSFFSQTQKSAANLIYNKTYKSFFATFTAKNPEINNFFVLLKNNMVYQKIHSYLFSLMDLTNLDLWQQRYRRVINMKAPRSAYPVKTKIQQRFINFREYVQIRRQFLGLALRKYGYKNNNPTRYATGQYFWAHHVLQKKILSLYQIKIPQFKQLVKQVYHTTYTCSKTMSLISRLEKISNTLAYRYNFVSSLSKKSPLCSVFDTNSLFSNNTFHQTLSKNKIGLLALYNPFVQNINNLNDKFCSWNYEKGYNLLPGFLSPRLFVQKLKKRQKLTSLQRKVGRCSWSKAITNIEWQSSNVNSQKYLAGLTFAPLNRFHNIYSNSYTINHKIISIIKLRTAA